MRLTIEEVFTYRMATVAEFAGIPDAIPGLRQLRTEGISQVPKLLNPTFVDSRQPQVIDPGL